MAEQTPIPEPPDGAWVVVGDDPHVLLVRDDHSAQEGGNEPGRHWFLGHDGSEAPLSWAQLTSPQSVGGWPGADRSVVQRVYTQTEVDCKLAAAMDVPELIPVGEHLMEAGGYCRSCGHAHSHTEWARIHDQLAEEADRG